MIALLAVVAAQLGLVAPAAAGTLTVGPVDPATGFPAWVTTGTDRLELCLDGPNCLGTRADLAPPDGEAFWFQAGATLTGDASGLVEVATEAAFGADGPDQEIAFNRVRIRLDLPEPGRYRVDYPYGSKTYDVGADLRINDTQDIGCLTSPCGDFAELADSGDGGVGDSFLRWDPAFAPEAPTGFLGDGVTEHRITGSPIGVNHVAVVRLTDDPTDPGATLETEVARTDAMSVQGKIARPRVMATPVAGSYAAGFDATLVGTEPGGEVWYTTDGSDPATATGAQGATAAVYSGPVPVTDDVTIRAVNAVAGVAVDDPVTGQVAAATEVAYVVDTVAPDLAASPSSGTYASAQLVTLTATDDKASTPRIYYTKALVPPGGQDPADPNEESTPYTGRIPVNGNLDEATTVIKAIAYDDAGNASPVVRREYTIDAPDVTASPRGGSFGQAVDVTLEATDPAATIYYSVDGQDPEITQDPDTLAVTGVVHGTEYTNDPIHLTELTTLKFLAASTAGQSTVMTEVYNVDIPDNRQGGNLEAVGPVDASNGYPYWYGDGGTSSGTGSGEPPVRLELCLQDPLCPVVGDLPDPAQPLSFPDNFPDESFWWSGEAAMDLPGGGSALLVLAQEAAFAADVAPGEQIAFARLRIRLDDVTPFARYTVTTPYGVDVVEADDRGRARMTEDIGCLTTPCTTWEAALDGRVGPFLRWDPAVSPAAPAGYVGNPLVEHEVVGSPRGTNYFRVEGPGVGSAETDMFAVQGKIAELRAAASPGGGLYGGPQDVRITASFPDDAKIVWTTNGSDPQVDAAGDPVPGTGTEVFVPSSSGPSSPPQSAQLTIPEGLTTLKFQAIDLADPTMTSEVYTEEYRVEGALPTVSATPDPTGTTFEGAQQVTLTSSVNDIFYTTDGTTPAVDASGAPMGSTRAYTGPFTVGRPTTVRAFAISELGSPGPVARFDYDIKNLRAVGPVSPANGFPTWFQDFGSPTLEPAKLELCLDDPLCPVIGDRPDPGSPVAFPGNFPDEAFWWSADAGFDAGATKARLVLGAEAAFGGGAPKANDQIAFARIRVRADNLVPGATYRVTHPYGVVELRADGAGSIFVTDDTGCLSAPCDFGLVLRGPIGPFLRWDTGAPTGYVGDGATPHAVVGSPYGTNVFRMEQVTTGGGAPLATPVTLGQTDQFVVQGKLAELRVTATPKGGTFTAAQQVTLAASEPTAEIHYTTDGSTPTAASTLYTGPVAITAEGATQLKFLAIGTDGSTSPVVTETYVIDTVAPTVSASPAGGSFPGSQQVTLSSDDPDAVIRYTTNGSTPTATSTRYTAPLTVTQSLTLKARAFDAAGNQSQVGSWSFVIGLPTSSLTLGTPSPATLTIGESTTLSGRLLTGTTGISGAVVALESQAIGATTWQSTGLSATTGTDGRFTLAGVAPTATTRYRVAYAGGAQAQGSVSATQQVGVRAIVTINPMNSIGRGRNMTVSGTLNPAHQGSRVTVNFTLTGQRSPKAVTATVAANGTWSVATKAPGKEGVWTVRADWGGDADHLAATATASLTVTR
ncbi:hypothetical protein GCM10009623_09270 [Nocardioides aestuarii]